MDNFREPKDNFRESKDNFRERDMKGERFNIDQSFEI